MARTLAVIGDRWTLLILRDCFLRVRRFEAFQERLGIGRPILTNRLRSLVDNGVLVRVQYHEKPSRFEYRLTPRGLDLYPVIMAIVHWGDVHTADASGRPLLHSHKRCGHIFDPVAACSHCSEVLLPHDVTVLPGPGRESRAAGGAG